MRLNRASFIYLGTLVIFAMGMWVLLEWGSKNLQAPLDLAGSYQPIRGSTGVANGFTIRQSGRFLQLQFEDGRLIHLTQTDRLGAQGESNPTEEHFDMEGDGWIVIASPASMAGDQWQFSFQPPAGQTTIGQFDRSASSEPGTDANNHAGA